MSSELSHVSRITIHRFPWEIRADRASTFIAALGAIGLLGATALYLALQQGQLGLLSQFWSQYSVIMMAGGSGSFFAAGFLGKGFFWLRLKNDRRQAEKAYVASNDFIQEMWRGTESDNWTKRCYWRDRFVVVFDRDNDILPYHYFKDNQMLQNWVVPMNEDPWTMCHFLPARQEKK